MVSALLTFVLFMYVLLFPLIKGEQPNVRTQVASSSARRLTSRALQYRHWRQSGVLSTVIPVSQRSDTLQTRLLTFLTWRLQVLTASILAGWSLLTFTLARWSNLGYIEGIIGGKHFIVFFRVN